MIDESILFLTHTDCQIPALKRHGLGIGPNSDLDILYVEPLKKAFSKVLVYDIWKKYAEIGVSQANQAVLDIVRAEHPRYLLWHSMMYEVLESTFDSVRRQGTLVVGWFSDDEVRFDSYSRWWAPHVDVFLTADSQALNRYGDLGATALHMMWGSNPEFFRKLDVPLSYPVSFVGRRFADRPIYLERLSQAGVDVRVFGRGWDMGYISTQEMVRVFNASRINLCFVKSYGRNTPPQVKGRIFDICMSGGFLLCEYMPRLEDFFKVGEEIVCFDDIEDAVNKIRYYLAHEAERRAIAQAGWERAHRDHTQTSRFVSTFQRIESCAELQTSCPAEKQASSDWSPQVRRLHFLFHFNWAKGLMAEGYPQERWLDELVLALSYDPANYRGRVLHLLGRLPAPIRTRLLQAPAGIGRTLMRMARFVLGRLPSPIRIRLIRVQIALGR